MENRQQKIISLLVQGTKYLYVSQIPAIVGTMVAKYGCPLTDELIEEIKDIILAYYRGNVVEPEWDSMEAHDWWHGLNASSFKKFDSGSMGWAVPPFKGKLFV